jgi:hypothetical protein
MMVLEITNLRDASNLKHHEFLKGSSRKTYLRNGQSEEMKRYKISAKG